MVTVVPVHSAPGLRFSVLGPVRAWRGAVEVDLGPPLQRALLSVLLLKEGARVSVAELAEALWGADTPTSSESGVRTYVYRLRRALEPSGEQRTSPIESTSYGYTLSLDDVGLDLVEFRRHVTHAQQALREGRNALASERLRTALALWNGDTALSGVPGSFAARQRARLSEMRLAAIEDLLVVSTNTGSMQLADVFALVRDNPLRERLWEILISALNRAGRRAEALLAFEECRSVLADELGVDPGAALRNLHERILRSDPVPRRPDEVADTVPRPRDEAGEAAPDPVRALPRRPPGADVVPAQLPADLPVFAGRSTELARLQAMLPPEGERPTSVTIGVVTGMPGVGKSALAVHWAHQVSHRFPDGQVYIDLRGYDATGTPIPVDDAMRLVVRSLGHDVRGLPEDHEALQAHYRTLLSRMRILLVLDNARDDESTRPLVAGASGSCVLVTSRTDLSGLIAGVGAFALKLDVLSPEESHDLVLRRLNSTSTSPERSAVRDVVDLCEGLPLAMSLVLAHAASIPHNQLSNVVKELRTCATTPISTSTSRLCRNLGRTFSWSWSALSWDAVRLLEAVCSGTATEFDLGSAAALAGLCVQAATPLMAELTDANLVAESSYGVYRCHGLLRLYGSKRGERAAARAQVLRQSS